MPVDWNFEESSSQARINSYDALRLLAFSPRQWQKSTAPSSFHFFGRWRGRSVVEFLLYTLFRPLAFSGESRHDHIIYGHDGGAYIEAHSVIALLLKEDAQHLRDACIEISTWGTRQPKKDIPSVTPSLLDDLSAACGRLNSYRGIKFSDVIEHAMAPPYMVVPEAEGERLKSEAIAGAPITRQWLVQLMKFAKYAQPGVRPPIIVATPEQVYVNPTEFVVDELLGLTADDLRAIFGDWHSDETEYHSSAIQSMQVAVRLARKHGLIGENALLDNSTRILLDAVLYHLRDEDTSPLGLTLAGLRDALGIAIGELRPRGEGAPSWAFTFDLATDLPRNPIKSVTKYEEIL